MSCSAYSPWEANVVQLAIETTGRTGSVAILQGESVLHESALPERRRTAAVLTPAVAEAIAWCRQQHLEPNLVAVAAGPGSFTGLRIGVTTAKALSYATRWPLVAVDSVAAIAATVFACSSPQTFGTDDLLLVGVNAYRQQVFTGQFSRGQLLPPIDASPAEPDPPGAQVLGSEAWQSVRDQPAPRRWLAGDRNLFGASADSRFLPRVATDAVGVGLLGLRAARAGRLADPIALVPHYLKLSAAEEKSEG